MRDAPRVIVGGIQFTEEDPLPSPIIAVSFPQRKEAEAAVKTLLAVQNGTRPFKSGAPVYVGDTNIKVRVRPKDAGLLAQVYAYAHPKHLTCAFYAAGRVDLETYKAFRNLVDIKRTYTFTVAAGDELLVKELNLLKYVLDEKEVKI